jgi:hypothetical protein
MSEKTRNADNAKDKKTKDKREANKRRKTKEKTLPLKDSKIERLIQISQRL